MVKNLPPMCEAHVRSLGWKDPPGEGNSYSLQYSCLGESHGQRSLLGYSLGGCKEQHDEQLTLTLFENRFSWRRKWQPTPVPLPGKHDGRRSLVEYSPWGRKESGSTERLHFHFTQCHVFQVKHPWMQTANYHCQVRCWERKMRTREVNEVGGRVERGRVNISQPFFKVKPSRKNKRTRRKAEMMELLPTALQASNTREYTSEEKLASRVKSIWDSHCHSIRLSSKGSQLRSAHQSLRTL